MGMTEAVQSLLESKGSTPLKSGISLAELIRRPELSYADVAPIDKNRPELAWDVQEQVNINIKYDGYIRRQMKQVEQFKKLEAKKIPEDLDYKKVKSLRIEARQKLELYRPVSIGQHPEFPAFHRRIFRCCWFIWSSMGKIVNKGAFLRLRK